MVFEQALTVPQPQDPQGHRPLRQGDAVLQEGWMEQPEATLEAEAEAEPEAEEQEQEQELFQGEELPVERLLDLD